MDLGTRLREWLELKGLTQKQLADAIGVSTGAVSMWMSGEHAPTNANLIAAVEWLGLSMAQFYGRVPKKRRARA